MGEDVDSLLLLEPTQMHAPLCQINSSHSKAKDIRIALVHLSLQSY